MPGDFTARHTARTLAGVVFSPSFFPFPLLKVQIFLTYSAGARYRSEVGRAKKNSPFPLLGRGVSLTETRDVISQRRTPSGMGACHRLP